MHDDEVIIEHELSSGESSLGWTHQTLAWVGSGYVHKTTAGRRIILTCSVQEHLMWFIHCSCTRTVVLYT